MKTIGIIILVVGAFLLIGLKGIAQIKKPTPADRDWIDSLAVLYRTDYIQGALISDQHTLDKMELKIDSLSAKANEGSAVRCTSTEELEQAHRNYFHEQKDQQVRRRAYYEEMRAMRTDFRFTENDPRHRRRNN